MILQALTEYYESLAARGEIARAGWTQVKVSYALVIDEQGQLTGLMPLKDEVMRGKKMVEVPRIYSLPQPVKRTAGIGANFLFDNAS